jgi:hypothetical protein
MPPLRLSRSASLALSALLLLPVGCTDTGEGYGVIGLNESSRDVIVTLQTSNGGSFLLKAGTWGTVAASFGPRKGDIVVSDLECNQIASLPWTIPNVTVEIRPDGTVRLTEFNRTMPPDIRPVDSVEGGALSSIRPC